MDFSSDNSFGVHPSIIEALNAVNGGSAHSYGGDDITARVTEKFREIFETDLDVLLVPTGSAANVLAISTYCSSLGSIFAHEEAHLVIEEGGAAEFYTGGAKVVPVGGFGAQIDPDALTQALSEFPANQPRAQTPSVLSLTQSTECGTVYTRDKLTELASIAKSRNMAVHMDGARFANALASTSVDANISPAEMTWAAGIDIVTFGASKNGAMSAEAIVVFDRTKTAELERRRLRAGHLLSKSRFIAAQMEAYFADDLWLGMARQANQLAADLSERLSKISGVRLAWPTDANEVFVVMPEGLYGHLEAKGARFYNWIDKGLKHTEHAPQKGETLRRLICSFDTPASSIDELIANATSFSNP